MINELLSRMTLDEKIGQLHQLGPSLVGAFEVSFEELLNMMFDGRISREEFDKHMSTAQEDLHEDMIRAGQLGSLNGVMGAEKLNRLQKIAIEESRLGIPLLFCADVIHGHKTIYPTTLAESCSWEDELFEKTARMAAEEATADGLHLTFAPMIDVARDARWGRISEGAGEDTYLTSRFAAAKVRGFQGDNTASPDSLLACAKHLVAYGAAEGGRDYNTAEISLQRLHETYLPPFRAAVEAGVAAIMPAFNDIAGQPCSANSYLLDQVVRGSYGFKGAFISDANAVDECVSHGIAADRQQAAQKAIIAGMDIDMSSCTFSENLKTLVEEGRVDIAVVDRAVLRVLQLKQQKNLFEHPYISDQNREVSTMLNQKYRDVSREAAQKSIVLLKNDGVLPLSASQKIAVVGSLADNGPEMMGAWAIKGDNEACISILTGLREINPDLIHVADPKDVLEQVKDCEVIVAVVGELSAHSGEASSRADITLPDNQEQLLQLLQSSGKPVVAVLINGRPLAIEWTARNIPAIVEAWHLGTECGHAVADILYGKINPSGKLTTSFPSFTGQCPIYYNHTTTGRPGGKSKFTSKYFDAPLEPVFPFGFGLSYTTYAYSNMALNLADETLTVEVDVTNTGDRAGQEIVQVYVRDVTAQLVRPIKELKGYRKVAVAPQQTVRVQIPVRITELGYFDQNMNYIVEPGLFRVFAGANSKDCLQMEITI